jgi:phage tail-like protein
MLSEAADWLPAEGSSEFSFCRETKCLALRSQRTGAPLAEDFATASALVEVPPMTRDAFDTYARWDQSSGKVVAGGAAPGEVTIYAPPAATPVTDLALGRDDILYVAVGGGLVFVDRRNRWPTNTLSAADFQFWRLLALPGGGVLALDRAGSALAIVAGQPLPDLPTPPLAAGVLGSCEQNPDAPRIVARIELPASEAFIALAATSDASEFALLSWNTAAAANQVAWLRRFGLDLSDLSALSIAGVAAAQAAPGLAAPIALAGVRFPYALAPLDAGRFAVLASNTNEALVYDLGDFAPASTPAAVAPAGDSYILAAANAGPFVHVFAAPPYYALPAATQGSSPLMLPLLPLSLNAFAPSGTIAAQRIFDGGEARCTWHRLFLEAVVPVHTGLIVWLAASDDAKSLLDPATPFYPHVLGSVVSNSLPADTPRAAWLSIESEVPFATPLLEAEPVPERSGTFMVLIQRANKAVRSLSGRYLAVKLDMFGDRRSTPQLRALRAYASRFSYVDRYLPELYREDTFGPDADADGQSTRPDFLQRFVALFEAQLTQIEDRIAAAHLLTRPESAPDSALDWLGTWIGVSPNDYPPDRRRARLEATPALYRERGTVQGIRDALDVATGGLVTRGAVIVVEDFRLRHTFVTILGADLSIKDDPLLPGRSASSNSFIGDTLFLGDELNQEFLTLFRNALPASGAGQQAVQAFLDSLAYRITVFVHDGVEPVDLGLVAEIVEQEKPAHVAANVVRASEGFMIGLASLVGVNSYLSVDEAPGAATVGTSAIGRHDVIRHLPSLDPRIEGDAPRGTNET